MTNDFLDEDTGEDWSEFKAEPTTGDLKILSDMVKLAAEIQAGLKKLETRSKTGQELLRNLLEIELPQMLEKCGITTDDSITFGGVTVNLKSDTYANVPSISSINDEKDDNKRAELKARREAALGILEAKAPTLIKRKYEISFDKDAVDQAQSVEKMLKEMDNPPEFEKGLSVHPKTLGKWIKENLEQGHSFSEEEDWAFGRYTRKVAKISGQ